MKGKNTCRILKEIRRQIAKANGIAYTVSECQYKGDCNGTCPTCESEVRELERELARRRALGQAVVIAGLSVGMVAGWSVEAEAQNVDKVVSQDSVLLQQNLSEKSFLGYIIINESPQFRGNINKYIKENLHYPDYLKNKGVEGRVVAQFTVEEDGSLQEISIIYSSDERFNQYVIQLLKEMPKWRPGIQHGRPVRAQYSLPIKFSLTE